MSVSLHDPALDGLAGPDSGRFRLEVHENAEVRGWYRIYRRSITGVSPPRVLVLNPLCGTFLYCTVLYPSTLASETYSAHSPNQGKVPEYALIFFPP